MIPIRDNIPTRHFPFITVIIMIINILVFFYEITLPEEELEQLVYKFGLLPEDVFGFNIANLVTHMFLHGDFGHIIGNMLFLWVFGNNVEDVLGRLNFILFYLLSGILAAFLQSIVSLLSGDVSTPMIGASGAVSGILAAYTRLFPFGKILTFIPPFIFLIFTLPAWFFIGYWFILQILYAMFVPVSMGGVAWYAHIGGFLAGWFLVPSFLKGPLKL
ncbi:MAG: rhomboid family intramembrane serine protease [Hydrogenothermaceae bacterium]|nr:rhomboid family intramembrane serine protease [Hydrogenothermaceae bacterium]